MDVAKMIGAIVAVGSVLLGGGLGATALERANSAPLKTESTSVAAPNRSGVHQVS
jgi:hypothetical protein